MLRIFSHRLARQGAILLLVLSLGGWGLRAMAPNAAESDAAPEAATSDQSAHMRAELERIHHGKVDGKMLARIAATSVSDVRITPDHAAFMPASASRLDTAAIAHYLAQPDGGAKATEAPGKDIRVVQAVAPLPVPAPSADRNYVGQKVCTGCHQQEAMNWAHTIHAKIFTLNPRDENEARGCEACHGPGSAHVKAPADLSTIISFSSKSRTPIAQQNAQCLGCHQGGARIFWHGSIHENNKLACSDCHNPMADLAAHGLTARESVSQTCFSCHKVQRAEFNKRSHMPLLEGKISCVDCHNPHGSTTQPLLKADSVNEVCYGCHAEKRGPFLFEHAPVRESCLNCHNPHGSNFEALLTAPRPMLCQSCHAQNSHPTQLMTMGNLAGGPRPDPRVIASSCQTCHVNIHGSNAPSGSRFER